MTSSWGCRQLRYCSLAEIVGKCNAPMVLVSSPEVGPRRKQEGGADFESPIDVPVMKIVEELPAKIEEHEGGERPLVFAVDFKGSASANFLDSRVRHVDAKEVVLCDADFSRKIDSSVIPKEARFSGELPSCEPDEALAIAHSAWLGFWRGQVSGALNSAMLMAQPKPTGCMGTELLDFFGLNDTSESARIVVALSIDGGPITQVEKSMLPSIFQAVLSNLKRRGYTWGKSAHIVWCHFPTVEDFLRSLHGVENLVSDEAIHHQYEPAALSGKCFTAKDVFDEEQTYPFISTTFKCVSECDAVGKYSKLLRCSVQEALNAEIDVISKLTVAILCRDAEASLYLLRSNSVDPNSSLDYGGGKFSLIMMAFIMSLPQVVEELLKMGCDVPDEDDCLDMQDRYDELTLAKGFAAHFGEDCIFLKDKDASCGVCLELIRRASGSDSGSASGSDKDASREERLELIRSTSGSDSGSDSSSYTRD